MQIPDLLWIKSRLISDYLWVKFRLIPDMEEKWKVITFQFGIKDLCSEPGFKQMIFLKFLNFNVQLISVSIVKPMILYAAPEEWETSLKQALLTLQNNLGKTIVLLITPFDVESLLRPGCSAERSLLQCSWINEGQQCR